MATASGQKVLRAIAFDLQRASEPICGEGQLSVSEADAEENWQDGRSSAIVAVDREAQTEHQRPLWGTLSLVALSAKTSSSIIAALIGLLPGGR